MESAYIVLHNRRIQLTTLNVMSDLQIRNHHARLGVQFDEGEVVGLVMSLHMKLFTHPHINHVQTFAQVIEDILTLLIRAGLGHVGINTDADILDGLIYSSC